MPHNRNASGPLGRSRWRALAGNSAVSLARPQTAVKRRCLLDVTAPLDVTASLGVAATTAPYDTPAALIQAADEALYEAKRQGRNRVELATEPTE